MATLGSYAKRQSQTASAADSTMQALMMLMQHQQQSEDRRLSRKQMELQSEQLRGLLKAQQREEVAQTPGTTAIRNISDVENQSVYSRLNQTIDSLNTFMDNPELASNPMLNQDLGLSPAVRNMQSGSPEEYAKIIRVVNTQLKQVQSMIDSSEVPAKEAQRFMEGLKSRIKDLGNNISEGVKFQQGYMQTLAEDNARSGTGLLVSESVENPGRLIPDDPLIEVSRATVNSFGKKAAEAGIRAVSEPVVDAVLGTLSKENAQTLQEQIDEDPTLIDTIGLAENATEAVEDIIGNIPEAEPGFFSKTGELLSDAGEVVADNPGTTIGTSYGLYKAYQKLWPLLKPFAAPLAKVLGGAEVAGRIGQEQGVLPGEGVFLGEDSMLQGSMSKMSRAQELQQGLPEDQRVGPIEGVLRGMGDEIYDLFFSNQKEATYVPIPRQQPQPLQGLENQPLYGLENQPLYGPENQPLYGLENQPLYGPENQPLYGPETQPPLQGPLTQDQAQLQALADKIENAVAQDQAQQQALIEAGIFPMAGVSPVDNLLQGPENQPLYGPENPFLNVPSEDLLSAIQNIYPNSSLNSNDVKDLKIQSPIPTLFDLMQDKQLARADAPVEEMTEEKKRQLLELAYPMDYLQKMAMGDSPAPPQQQPPPLYGPENQPLYGPENQPLYGPETQPPPLYGPETQPPLYGPETQPLYGPPAPTPLQQETQMGAEEYLRALSIRQAQQQEMQQALLGLMQQPF